MMGITELAPAKLNLTLDVGARRPDGYHDITSIMQSATTSYRAALCMMEVMSWYPSGRRLPRPGSGSAWPEPAR